MALSRLHTWVSGEVLTASDLNAEFNNIINNLSVALVGTIIAGTAAVPGLGIVSDTDTGIFSPGSNRIGLAAGGVQVFEGSAYASGVNYLLTAPGQAGQTVLLTATGSDTNVNLTLRGKGTGYVTASKFAIEAFAATQSSTLIGRTYYQSTERSLHVDSGSVILRAPLLQSPIEGRLLGAVNPSGVSGATVYADIVVGTNLTLTGQTLAASGGSGAVNPIATQVFGG